MWTQHSNISSLETGGNICLQKQKQYLGNQLPQVSIESLYSGRFFFCRNCRGQVSNKTEILPVDNDDQQFHKNRHAGYWCHGN